METSYIGIVIVAVAILGMVAHIAYGLGYRIGGNTERLSIEARTAQDLVDYENKRKPKAKKNKLKAARRSRVGSISVCV